MVHREIAILFRLEIWNLLVTKQLGQFLIILSRLEFHLSAAFFLFTFSSTLKPQIQPETCPVSRQNAV
jgi:hypothetical protein